MTTTWGQSYLYGSISRLLLTTTRSYAICPLLKSVLVASRSAAGGMTFSGQTSTMAFQPLEITQDGTHFYAIGETGVEKHTMAPAPVFANLFSFDAGLGKFIFSQGSYLVVPDGDSGVQTISRTTGVVQDSLPGVLSKIHTGCYDSTNRRLWLFDQDRAKGVSIQVGTAGQLTYASSFAIPNCRNIVRAVFDSTASRIFIVNDHRIVSFSTSAWEELTVAADYGANELTFTDFAKIGTNQYWIGTAEPSNGDAIPGPFGPQYGAWDSVNAEMQIACPKMSLWTVNNAIPYWSVTTIPEIIITPPPVVQPVVPPVIPPPPPYVPPVIVPAPPVITSALTATVTEDTLFGYTITATGTGPITYGVTLPPAWLTSVNSITGAIAGIPPDPATINITIKATNAGGTTSATLVVTVNSAIGNNTGVYTNNTVTTVELDASGTLAYCAGTFTSVTDASGTYTRNRLACLNLSTGRWTSWNPNSNANMYFAIPNTDGYVYVGADSTLTLGGVARSRVGRVNSTTGALDAAWTPTFSGDARSACCLGSTIYFVGNFQTVNGSARPLGCSFIGGSLTSWKLQNTLGQPMRSRANISGAGTLACVRVFGTGIFVAGADSGLYLDDATPILGYRSQGYAIADASSGFVAQSARGINNANSFATSVPNCAAVIGSVIYAGVNLGPQVFSELPLPLAPADPTTFVVQITAGGDVGSFAPVVDASSNIASCGSDGAANVMVGGTIPSFGGDTSRKSLAKYSSSGVLDTSFTFTSRGNAAFIASAPSISDARYTVGAIVVAGTFGGPSQTYGGIRAENILVLNAATGARL